MRRSSSLLALVISGLGVACTETPPPKSAAVTPIVTCNSPPDCAAAVSRDPADPHLRVKWALRLEEAGKATMAAREFRAAIRLVDDEDDPIDEAASGLMRLGDSSGCVAELDAQIENAQKVPALANALRRAREKCVEAARKAD